MVAFKNGEEWAVDVQKTSGFPYGIQLSVDHLKIEADGEDLEFVTAQIVDKAGLEVPDANNLISFSIEGPGHIVATDNGDPTSFVAFSSPERNAFSGKCLAIVKGEKGEEGSILVKATSESIETGSVEINLKLTPR